MFKRVCSCISFYQRDDHNNAWHLQQTQTSINFNWEFIAVVTTSLNMRPVDNSNSNSSAANTADAIEADK